MLVGRAGIENGLGIREPVALNTPEFFTLNLKVAYDIPVYKSITLQVNAGCKTSRTLIKMTSTKAGTAIQGTSTDRRFREVIS